MCECEDKCKQKSEYVDIEVTFGEVWVYNSQGEFQFDFPVNFCPLCGKQFREVKDNV